MSSTNNDLKELDLSVLDDLTELQSQRVVLLGRLKQMEERRNDVAAPVYLRVRADYEQQRIKLESEEAPKKRVAKDIYLKLRDRLDALEREDGEAKLNLQELEFRHSLGEFDRAQFNVRKSAIEAGVKDRESDFSQAREIRERFLSIFGSEHELDEPLGSATVIASAPFQAPPAFTPIPQAIPAPQVPGMPPIPLVRESSAPPIPAEAPKAEPRKPANPDATVVFRPGRLTPMNPEAGIAPTMLSLKPIHIGSDNSCDIRITAPNLQRKQVEITLTRAGFMLKDVGGGGIVLIDGQAITEQLLRDGDTIQIGPARFSFKLA
jgi:hypothetical protein